MTEAAIVGFSNHRQFDRPTACFCYPKEEK
jgi:hypothetical protein